MRALLAPVVVLLTVLSNALLFTSRSEAADGKPNVLIITTDQQREDALSVVGNRWLKTPHMDAIAAQGVCFTQSYCSYPLCSPSRASLHTSRMPHELGVDHNNMPIHPSIPLSGQVFRAAGYDTGYAGKWHVPETYPQNGIAGFDVLNRTQRQGKLAHDVDEATMTAAIDFLKRKRETPFLLVVSFINPHDICLLAGEPTVLAAEVARRYEPAPGADVPPLPDNFAPTVGGLSGAGKTPRHEDWTEEHWRRYRYAYYRMVEDVDQQVGQVLQALRASGQEDNTIVAFTSDHGEGLASHRWTGKMMYYEEEAAVPLIISWKGVTPAGRIDKRHLISTLDVLPTLCDYAGVPGPAVMRGQSLRGVIENPQLPGHQYVVSEMAPASAGRSFMVRSANYKYMVFPGTTRSELLFDLRSDPGEMRNLAADSAAAAELDRHRTWLAEWNTATEEDKHPIKPNPSARKKAAKQKRAKSRA